MIKRTSWTALQWIRIDVQYLAENRGSISHPEFAEEGNTPLFLHDVFRSKHVSVYLSTYIEHLAVAGAFIYFHGPPQNNWLFQGICRPQNSQRWKNWATPNMDPLGTKRDPKIIRAVLLDPRACRKSFLPPRSL